jgi:F0F1-type ATP synthase assembly protein I
MTETRAPGSKESSPLQFSPLHQGVGFHPFSDGLPYAPAVPTRTAQASSTPMTGTGAVAAGPARPVITKPLAQPIQAPRIPSPIVPPTIRTPGPTIPRPEAFQRHQQIQAALQPSPAPAQAAVTSAATTEAAPTIEKNFGWTYPLARAFAFTLDVVLNVLVTATVVTLALAFADLEPWFLLEGRLVGMTLFFLVAFTWALMAAQEIVFKTTVGKRLMGLKLRGNATEIFLRSFFFLPSIGFAGAGILWALFDREKRCWHDVAINLQPTRMTQL